MRNHKAFDIAAVAERFFSDAPYLIAVKFGRNLDSAGDFLVTIDYLRLIEMQNITVRTAFCAEPDLCVTQSYLRKSEQRPPLVFAAGIIQLIQIARLKIIISRKLQCAPYFSEAAHIF